MKKDIHPDYKQIKVTCVCGNTFTTGSTLPEIRVEICNKCHPFFTGQQKFVDTQGQVEKFTKSQAASEAKKAERIKIVEARVAKVQKVQGDRPSLKDMLLAARKQKSA